MEMVENLERMKNVDHVPKVEMRSVDEFFDRAKKDAKDLAVWVGELVITSTYLSLSFGIHNIYMQKQLLLSFFLSNSFSFSFFAFPYIYYL